MFVDSHCHINFPELAQDIDGLLDEMARNQVTHALCVSVNLPEWPSVMALADAHPNIYASVGVHPDYEDVEEPTVARLVELAQRSRVVAIGETGLDYYRLQGDLEWQRERFRVHIRAARQTGLPLIVHTRAASEDTIRILQEEGAADVGGVMHCFTESWEVAQAAMALGFHISFSGIVTFKKAEELKEVARRVPLDRMLIETDSPYLAPVPFRGKTNQPAWVRHVAEHIAELKAVPLAEVAAATTSNFFRLFQRAAP
ncbi:TatD family hydrolase [Chitiniphilus purpureus]|uniref:TatD family hydrolase n=1 Tax=Chitiniphilus purpureus TaxID=2981137 RepID=A0ABY6DKL3_9NEIS|nr:TatD family hydrolase [Chitiniphilus sp. CD1]UXY14896.1 TatD family hydrolase [Chitiniphilus sp. CD1]